MPRCLLWCWCSVAKSAIVRPYDRLVQRRLRRHATITRACRTGIPTFSVSICMQMPARGRTSSQSRSRGQVRGPSYRRAAHDRACRRRTAHSHSTNHTKRRIQYHQLRVSPAARVRAEASLAFKSRRCRPARSQYRPQLSTFRHHQACPRRANRPSCGHAHNSSTP